LPFDLGFGLFSQAIDDHKADIVSIAPVTTAGISQTDDHKSIVSSGGS
jgi:hypothetical protein